MNFTTAIRTCLSKYATLSGRAQRSEYWWWFLFTTIVSIVASIVDSMIFGTGPDVNTPVTALSGLALLLPSLGVAVRRLHDTDRSGWWVLLFLIPFVGWIVLIVWYCQASVPGHNRFGPDPFGRKVVSAG